MRAGRCNVLIPDGGSNFAAAVLRCLAEAPGIRPRVLARSRWVPVNFSRHVAGRMAWRGGIEDYVANVEAAVRRWGPGVLLPTGCLATEATIALRAELERVISLPPLPRAESFQLSMDKSRFARFLGERNLPHPPTSIVEGERVEPDPWRLEFPLLYKPAQGSYGIGIEEIPDARSLDALLARCRARGWRGVLQSAIPGEDIDLSVLADGGRIVAHTIQRGLAPPRRRFGPASFVEFIEDPAVHDLGARLVADLDWSGVGHIDLRRDRRDGRLYLLELNPRYWGSVHASARAGVNFPALAAAIGAGDAVPAPRMKSCRYATIAAAARGWLTAARGDRPRPRWRDVPLVASLTDPGPTLSEFAWKARGRFLPDFADEPGATAASSKRVPNLPAGASRG